jgi:hypothetical protein
MDTTPIGGTIVDGNQADLAGETHRSAGSVADARRASPPAPFNGGA